MKTTTYSESPNIVESEVGLVVKTRIAPTDRAVTNEAGQKILKAGTKWEDHNSENPMDGVILQDYDVTGYTTFPVAVVFQGRLYADRVSEEVYGLAENYASHGLYFVR